MSCDILIVSSADIDVVEVGANPTTVLETVDSDTLVVNIDEPNIVLVDAPGDTLVIEPALIENTVVLTVGEQGPPGGGSTDTLRLNAVGPISGHRAIRSDGAGRAVYASNDEPASASGVLGVSLNAALDGDPVLIQFASRIDEPSWSWTPNQPVFCGPAGLLTQVAPTQGFVLVVGVAITPTALVVDIKQPIITI